MVGACCVLTLNQGWYVCWQCLVATHRVVFQCVMREADTVFISSAASLVWHTEYEVSIAGRMFDVMEQVSTDSGIILAGCFDGREDVMLVWFCHALRVNAPFTKPKGRFFLFDALELQIELVQPWYSPNAESKAHSRLQDFLSADTMAVPTPPPKRLV